MKFIIGLDFGNYNSFPCFISDIDLNLKRLGGNVHDLLPSDKQDGIPSAVFYSQKIKRTAKPLPWYGDDAVGLQAVPVKNRVRLLKRHLGEHFTLDDRTFSYDECITQVIQYCIRRANKILKEGWQTETNLVSLSYPATYTYAQRMRLIELAEKASLEDGTKVKVFGTIAEPAAAALDYLSESAERTKDTTILTYDLGGGTFDLALVSVYPKGKKTASGGMYYYDIINTRGIGNLGGAEFDEVLSGLFMNQAERPLKEYQKREIYKKVEEAKKELSRNQETALQYFDADEEEDVQIFVTREQFEKASANLVKRTVDKTREMLKDHVNQKPEVILLTGGASQMPMIRKALEAAFPEYKGKIIDFRPTKAIAYGAARYGAVEEKIEGEEVKKKKSGYARKDAAVISPIQQRTMYDIGVRLFRGMSDPKGYILTYFKAGEVTPCRSKDYIAYTTYPNQSHTLYQVYEAKGSNPNTENVDADYIKIMDVDLDHGKKCAMQTESATRLIIDKQGRLTIEAWETKNPANLLKNKVELKNLS